MLKTAIIAIIVFLGAFTATALAADATGIADAGGLLDLLKPVWLAFTAGKHLYAGMLALVAAVALLKRYAPTRWGIRDFVWGDVGGALLTLVGSFAGAMATSLAAGEGASWLMVKTALYIAFGAAGGYSLIKRLLVDPILRPLSTKTPAWMQPFWMLLFWVFDRPTPIAAAETAGDAAVAANPPTGAEGVIGKSEEI